MQTFYRAGPAGIPTQVAFSQNTRWPSLDLDRAEGCIRSTEHAFSKEGGLAVLRGNIALDGCVVKTAGVDESILVFEGTAHVTESQDEAVANILADKVKAGDVVVVRYEGPKGGPGMQEMLYPTSYIKSKGLGKACALLTDGRFSGGTSGPVDRSLLAGSGCRRRDRPGAQRRQDPHRYPQPDDQRAGVGRRTRASPRRAERQGLEACASRGRARCRPRSRRTPSWSCRRTRVRCATCRNWTTDASRAKRSSDVKKKPLFGAAFSIVHRRRGVQSHCRRKPLG